MSAEANSAGPPTHNHHPIILADSGTTSHFAALDLPVLNKRVSKHPIAITNPNGEIMYSTHEGELDIPGLPYEARKCHIVPDLACNSLLSIGQLCSAGCRVLFDTDHVTVYKNGKTILTGSRTLWTNNMWHMDLPPASQQANAAIGTSTPAELVAFAQASLFSPALSTLTEALKRGYLKNCPGLSDKLLRRHPPQSYAMVKGHLDQSRKNHRSTTTAVKSDNNAEIDEEFPVPTNITIERANACFATIFEPTGQIYTDLTGRFIAPSTTGNQYLFILYDHDSNCILAEPLKTRKGADILAAYKTLHAKLCKAGLPPQLQRLDNECSDSLKEFMVAENIDYQLVPPNVHRRNAAERAIRTFKNHFVAGLCSVDKDFPIKLWDRLIEHAVISLNLLRGSRINPTISAWEQIHGKFDFNRTPLAPPGIRVLVHEKPTQRATWAPHAVDGWYIGPALEHYRCHQVWIWESNNSRICDTISWFPSKVSLPRINSNDLILSGIQTIVTALQNPSADTTLAPLQESHLDAVRRITTLLTDAMQPIHAPPLRVDEEVPSVPATDTPSLRVETTPSEPATYDSIIKQKRRRRKKTTKITIPSLVTPIINEADPPNTPSTPPRPPHTTVENTHDAPTPRIHNHDTRANSRKPIAQHTTHSDAEQFALHGNAFNPDTGQLAEYTELSKSSEGQLWIESCTDEIGRLCRGHKTMSTGTNTMFFIPISAVPSNKKATYLRIVAAYRPEKTNPRRVRFTVGGDRITYEGDVSTKAADLSTVKILLNSVVSTPGAKFMTADLKDFYLNTPMDTYEYMRIPVSSIPAAIMEEYELEPLMHKGNVYVEIRKGMYGLPQAGKIASDRLTELLAPHGYAPVPYTPGLWTHTSGKVTFTLVVDDFGIKYTDKAAAQHLLDVLYTMYTVSEDWNGTKYCGITLEWDYLERTCDISMPGYIERALLRFQHPLPIKPEHAPHIWIPPNYGATTQYAPEVDHSPPLDAAELKRVQEVLGTLLYYARAVDPTLLTAIGTLASQQTNGTKATMTALTQLLNYCATHPDAKIRFHASDMVLHIESDASYLSAPKSRSRAAGYHFLSSMPFDPTTPSSPNAPPPPANGAITILCQIMREVVSSAAEAELAALFHNGKEACPLRAALEEMGHPQPATTIITDNSTASGIANDTVKQKRSKAMDMRFYWIRDRTRQGQFLICWKKGSLNRADYFSKHHPARHHQAIRSSYLHDPSNPARNYFDCLYDNIVDTSGQV